MQIAVDIFVSGAADCETYGDALQTLLDVDCGAEGQETYEGEEVSLQSPVHVSSWIDEQRAYEDGEEMSRTKVNVCSGTDDIVT